MAKQKRSWICYVPIEVEFPVEDAENAYFAREKARVLAHREHGVDVDPRHIRCERVPEPPRNRAKGAKQQ